MCVYEMGNLRVIDLSKILTRLLRQEDAIFSVLIQEARFRFPYPYGSDEPSGNALRVSLSS